MRRSAWALIVVLLSGAHATASFLLFQRWMMHQPLSGTCRDYLESPSAGWLKLQGCELTVADALLESEGGDFETLENRRQGLSRQLFDGTPKWVAVWLPMTGGVVKGGPRAILRNESQDLLKWVNALEQASNAERDRMWQDPIVLRRMSRPGLVEGIAEKPTADVLRRAYGSTGSVNLYVVRPGTPEPMQHPSLSILLGFVVIGVIGALLNKFVKVDSDLELTPEQVTARTIVGKTRVELGELEALREEERAEQRNKQR